MNHVRHLFVSQIQARRSHLLQLTRFHPPMVRYVHGMMKIDAASHSQQKQDHQNISKSILTVIFLYKCGERCLGSLTEFWWMHERGGSSAGLAPQATDTFSFGATRRIGLSDINSGARSRVRVYVPILEPNLNLPLWYSDL